MSTDPNKIKAIFLKAVEQCEPGQWSSFLDTACEGDANLRRRVEVLLEAHLGEDSLLDVQARDVSVTIDQPLAEKPGTQIGPYKLLQQIGEGGMGVVYMAEQTEPVKRRVALKIIKPGMDSRQVIARFEAERQALSLMDHPNIAKVLDAGATESGRPYFVMELVKGQPITQYCDEHHLTPRQRLELLLPVCQAIQHAHQKGIIHRDIKPTNILVAEYDQQPVPKVIDFGVAKATSQTLTEKTMFTGYGQIVGTLEYMSPEQAKVNQLDIDTRSDIYSLGVLLYELLTGSTPFDRKRLRSAAFDEMLRIIREEEPPKPSTRLSDSQDSLPSISAQRHTEPAKLTKLVRGELDWIVMKALEKDRSRRYETANAFAVDLQHYLSDEPVVACPPSAGYRFRKFARRNRSRLVTAGALAIAMLVAVGGIAWAAWDRHVQEITIAIKKAAQDEKVGTQVRAILDDVERLERLEEWAEARAAVQRAAAALTAAGGDSFLHQEVRRHASELQHVEAVENARLTRGGNQWRFDFELADRAMVAVFDSMNIPVKSLTAEEVGRRIRGHAAITPALIAALDDWMAFRRFSGRENRHLIECAQAADEDPFRRRIRSALLNRDDKAIESLVTAPDLPRRSAATNYLLAVALPTSDQRIKVLRAAHNEHPDDFWLNISLGLALAESRPARFRDSIPFLRTSVALRPQSLVRPILGYALLRSGERDEARTILEKAIELHPRLATSYTHLSHVLFWDGKLDEAIATARKAIELDPLYCEPHADLSWYLCEKGKLDEAIAEARKAIEILPHHPWAYCNLGLALKKQGNLLAAEEALRKSIEFDPRLSRWRRELGHILVQQGRIDEAIEAYRAAIENDPAEVFAHLDFGVQLARQKRYPEAIRAFRRVTELDPKNHHAFFQLGLVYRQQDKLPQAVDSLRRAVELDDHYPDAHVTLAQTAADLQQYEEAIASYRKAIALDPNHARAHNNLAWLLATASDEKLRNLPSAVELARKAVELTSQGDGSFWNTLGVASYRAGDWKAAIEALEKSEKLTPGNGLAFNGFFLAMAHWQLGEKVKAREWYDKAVKWMAENNSKHEELQRFRDESARLLGLSMGGDQ